jgi:hypothetical protein
MRLRWLLSRKSLRHGDKGLWYVSRWYKRFIDCLFGSETNGSFGRNEAGRRSRSVEPARSVDVNQTSVRISMATGEKSIPALKTASHQCQFCGYSFHIAATPAPPRSMGGMGSLVAGLVLYSEYTLKTTGCGLPGWSRRRCGCTIEGVSYLAVVGIAGYSLYVKAKTGKGLQGGALLGAADALSFLASFVGLVVLAFQVTDYGYILNLYRVKGASANNRKKSSRVHFCSIAYQGNTRYST